MAEATHAGDAVIEPEVATHAEAGGYFTDGAVIVAIAMALVIALMLWKKVPAAIGKSLDAKIAAIREQLDEAKALRAEAEALKTEYEAKSKAATKDAEAIVARANEEAEAIVTKAAADAKALVARKKAMAEAKIEAEARAAMDEIKATAASAAAAAAAAIIAEKGDAAMDAKLTDEAIASIN